MEDFQTINKMKSKLRNAVFDKKLDEKQMLSTAYGREISRSRLYGKDDLFKVKKKWN
ncbi:MAG: hypothetical protein J5U19_05090 [Candidatus Methanoperedens sp.]|nr:hypothetical protein [Candidatus Methanoperedens sp.]